MTFAPILSALSRHSGPAADLAVMAVAGIFFAAIGPFDTDTAPLAARFVYWPAVMIAGGFVILATEFVLDRRWPHLAALARPLLVTLLATPVQTAVVMTTGILVFRYRADFSVYLRLLPAVLIVTLVAVAVMEIARRARARPGGEPTAAHPAPLPKGGLFPPPGALTRHLPAPLRHAPLLALQAEDHYVRVHTLAGSGLVLMRFRDAAALVGDQAGFRLHRSWWAAEAALEAVSFARGSGTARLKGGLVAPVSRSFYPKLREAGWF